MIAPPKKLSRTVTTCVILFSRGLAAYLRGACVWWLAALPCRGGPRRRGGGGQKGTRRVPQLLATIYIPVIGVERVPREGLPRLRLVRDHLPRGRLRGPLSDVKRQAHRVRSSFLKSFLAHPYTLVVHGQQRLQGSPFRREDILGLAELPGLTPELAVGDLCC